MKKLYRVMVKTTGSIQPGSGGTTWQNAVLYCGYDREEAVRIYHESKPGDYWYGYGNRARRTLGQSKGCEMDVGALIGEVRKCLPEGWTANESCGFSLITLKATTPPRVQVMTTRHSLGTGRNKDQEQAMIRDDLRGRGFRILIEGCRLYVEGIEA